MFRRHILARYRLYSRRTRRYVLHNILHADDPPHKLALGIALAMFVTFTPTVGFQMVLVFFLAWLLRANKAVGVPLVWLSNPVTIPPIFFGCYWVGAIVMGTELNDFAWFQTLAAEQPPGWWAKVTYYIEKLMEIAAPLWLGSVIVATALAIPTYYICYRSICWYRIKRWGNLVPPSAAESQAPSTESGNETAAQQRDDRGHDQGSKNQLADASVAERGEKVAQG